MQDPTVAQRQASFHGQTAVHAAFGDVELAQMTLRSAIQEGMDFEQALQDPELVEITTSQQVSWLPIPLRYSKPAPVLLSTE